MRVRKSGRSDEGMSVVGDQLWIRKPSRKRIKKMSGVKFCARSMKTEINISQTAREIIAICSFLMRIPAEETPLSFMNI
jgi:hypothetical protein